MTWLIFLIFILQQLVFVSNWIFGSIYLLINGSLPIKAIDIFMPKKASLCFSGDFLFLIIFSDKEAVLFF